MFTEVLQRSACVSQHPTQVAVSSVILPCFRLCWSKLLHACSFTDLCLFNGGAPAAAAAVAAPHNHSSTTSHSILLACGSATKHCFCLSADQPDPFPPFQTFASCFNGGAPGSTGTRRCSTYRSTTGNSTLSCPAQFVDYRFAFYGSNGEGSRHVSRY
jgi:hypothetical protein